MEEKLKEKLRKHYKQVYNDLEKQFESKSRLLAGEDNVMQLKLKDGIITQTDYRIWRSKLEKELHKQVNDLADMLSKADYYAIDQTNKAIPKAYVEGMNKQLFEVEAKYKIPTEFDIINERAVPRAATGRFIHKGVKSKIIAYNRRRIQSTITAAILRGESVPKVAKALLPVVNGNTRSALLNARTWLNSAENGGHYDEAERLGAAGIKMKKMWLSAGDDRVRDSHRELDGEERDIDDNFSNGGRFPCDPLLDAEEYYNCRCTMLTYPEGYGSDLSKRKFGFSEESYEKWKAGKHGN